MGYNLLPDQYLMEIVRLWLKTFDRFGGILRDLFHLELTDEVNTIHFPCPNCPFLPSVAIAPSPHIGPRLHSLPRKTATPWFQQEWGTCLEIFRSDS